MSDYSSELLARAQTVIPSGVNSPVRSFKAVGGDPIFFKSGSGPYLRDVNNKQYIDYVNSWGNLILGHAHPKIIQALIDAAHSGLSFGAPTELEVLMAETLTKLVPSLEKVRLVCSGTESTQSAIRLARGFTKRHKILKFEGCYHGHVDSLLVKSGSGVLTFALPDSAGVPPEFTSHTITVPYNDSLALEKAFVNFGSSIAAVIVEPIAANMNCVLPLTTFLPKIRSLCDQYQSLLIFDEVITGFRVHLGGAQELYSIKPDLTCLGKIIGGGMPIAAFGGKREIMDHIAPNGPVYQAGTLAGNPVAVAAGLATLKEIEKPGTYELLKNITENLIQNIFSLASEFSIPLKIQGITGLFGLFFTEENCIINYNQVENCDKKSFTYFFHAMLKEGIYFAPSPYESGFLSLMHSNETTDRTLEAIRKIFKKWPKAF